MPCARFVVLGPSDRGLRCGAASQYLLLLSRVPAAPRALARGGGGERHSNRVPPSAARALVIGWKGFVTETGIFGGVAGAAEVDALRKWSKVQSFREDYTE